MQYSNTWHGLLERTTAVVTAGWQINSRAVAGHTLADGVADLDARLADLRCGRLIFLCNWGANDVGYPAIMADEAAWEANYLTVIDGIRARYPHATVYLVKPWRRGYATECDTLAGWIDTIIAARPGVAFVGHDERDWLEGGDDGATMSSDGTHYSAAGQIECAAQWATVLAF